MYSTPIENNPCPVITTENITPDETDSLSTSVPSTSKTPTLPAISQIPVNVSKDVGDYIGKRIDKHVRKTLLENPWKPPEDYTFPFSTRTVSGKAIKHYISQKHLDQYKDWLEEANGEEADANFRSIYSDAKGLAQKLDIPEQKPRTCARQTKRENYSVSTCEDYYRVSVYIPLLDTICEDLKSRFSRQVLDGFQLSLLLPLKVYALDTTEIENLISCLMERFKGLISNDIVQRLKFKGELNHWKCYWQQKRKIPTNKLPTTALQALENCDVEIFPTIHAYLRLFCTLPVTNASSERSFSTLRCMKTWLRSTMLQERLIGLALLYTHQDIEVSPEAVIERFAKLGPRRFVL